jgi:nitrous oxidase accessory protein
MFVRLDKLSGAAFSVLLSCGGHQPPPVNQPSLAEPSSGPVARTADATTGVVVSDSVALAHAIANPTGPTRIQLEPHVYRGDFSVKRPLELAGTKGAVLEGTGNGTVLTLEGTGIRVSDILVRHSGRRTTLDDAAIRASGEGVRIERVATEDTLFGISLEGCKRCVVENAHVTGGTSDGAPLGDAIKLWESDDSVVRGSVVENSRDIVVWYSRRALLEDNYVTKSRYGAHFMYAHDGIVRRMRVIDNVVGIFVMYSSRVHAEDNVLAGARGAAGVGIGFKDSDDVTLVNNWLVSNTVGTYFDSTPRSPTAKVTFERNVVALNGVGVQLHSSERGVRFYDNDFHENAATIEVEGGGDARQVEFRGNYFSSYEGYDLDGDGFGDVPYQEKRLSSALTEGHPLVKLFRGTLALGSMDAAAKAVPVLQAKTLFADASPRVQPGRLVVR